MFVMSSWRSRLFFLALLPSALLAASLEHWANPSASFDFPRFQSLLTSKALCRSLVYRQARVLPNSVRLLAGLFVVVLCCFCAKPVSLKLDFEQF